MAAAAAEEEDGWPEAPAPAVQEEDGWPEAPATLQAVPSAAAVDAALAESAVLQALPGVLAALPAQTQQIYEWWEGHLEASENWMYFRALRRLVREERLLGGVILWGCVENCVVLAHPGIEPAPPAEEWPVLWLDNENGLGIRARTLREALATLVHDLRFEADTPTVRPYSDEQENQAHKAQQRAAAASLMATYGLTEEEVAEANQASEDFNGNRLQAVDNRQRAVFQRIEDLRDHYDAINDFVSENELWDT